MLPCHVDGDVSGKYGATCVSIICCLFLTVFVYVCMRFCGFLLFFADFRAFLCSRAALGLLWDALRALLGAPGALLGTLGALLGALGALLGRSWDALGALGSLLGASWTRLAKKPGCAKSFEVQLGSQNEAKLAPKSSKNRCQVTNRF